MKYYDIPCVTQVIGCIYNNPSLLSMEDKYSFSEDDFNGEEFHKIIFGTIYNLYQLGAKEINLSTIEDYLEQRPKKYAIYTTQKGDQYLQSLAEIIQPSAFDYYYHRLKKMTLLRMYSNAGLDLQWIYDDNNIFDSKKKQVQEEWLDNHTLAQIADEIDKHVSDIRLRYVDATDDDFIKVGNDIDKMLLQFKTNPEIGYPLYGSLINTVHRGARLKKFYLRSAGTGMGKTRAMIADACNIACDELYDPDTGRWEINSTREPVLFIATEQDEDEIRTMALAFLSYVNEEHIVTAKYEPGEEERVNHAAALLGKCPLYLKKLPDFSLQDVENTIKYAIREFGARYLFFDYIHSSMKILSEVGTRSGVTGLREDNVLFLMSVKLKDICNQYGVFIMSGTQLNGDFKDATIFDQTLLRGAKSIADKADMGMIMLSATQADKDALAPLCEKLGVDIPDMKMSIYKNRRGRYKDILLWCKAELGVCRLNPIFATDYNYELIPIKETRITITPKMTASAF